MPFYDHWPQHVQGAGLISLLEDDYRAEGQTSHTLPGPWERVHECYLTESLVSHTLDPEQINNDVHDQQLEHMVIIMYSMSCVFSRVDEAKHYLFSNDTKSLKNLPPINKVI